MWLKRAVAITLILTLVLFGGILLWGFGFSADPSPVAVSDAEVLPTIAPIDETQPGSDSQNGLLDNATSATGASDANTAIAPTTAPVATGGTTGGLAGSTGSTGAQPTTAPTPVPTAPPAACGAGGACHAADIQGHATAGDCRTAINIDGTVNAYAPSQTFLTNHGNDFKQIVGKLCGKVYSANLRQAVGEHSDGSSLSGMNFQQYINNFYIGPYN